MKKFEVNKIYRMTFLGDSDLIVPITIIKRTDKTVVFKKWDEKPKRVKIHTYKITEYIYPTGNYSMAPSCDADKLY